MMIAQLLGGIGLFLLGMLLLTDGLRTAAGETLKRILVRFTGNSRAAFFSGFTITALVQSSSATTLATIGFVSAGLLTFSQSIGIMLGGSVGTTTTGWLVSLLGLKLSLGKIAMPLVGIGALMRLVLKDRPAALGLALAGFGLIFVGIETLQQAMGDVASLVRPESLPGSSLGGLLLLVLIGAVLTVIMQASSAAVATTITAYHAGTLHLEQALALVIGASIGTTATSALAAMGASVPARRTALVHVCFNTFAGGLGLLIMPLFVWAVRLIAAPQGGPVGAWSIAVFHTTFHLLGALIVLPGVHHLSRLIVRLIPDRGPALTRHLDESLIQIPEVALEALRRALVECAGSLSAWIRDKIEPVPGTQPVSLVAVRLALRETSDFLARIPASPSKENATRDTPRLALVHALDHLERLTEELSRIPARPLGADRDRIAAALDKLHALLTAVAPALTADDPQPALATIGQLSRELADVRRTGRHALLQATADARLSPETADFLLDQVRWMDTAAYHLWRAVHHLHFAQNSDEAEASAAIPAGRPLWPEN